MTRAGTAGDGGGPHREERARAIRAGTAPRLWPMLRQPTSTT